MAFQKMNLTNGHCNKNSNPPFWTGLKFFNVYGPNEYHKGRMASMVFHGYHQIKKTGSVKLLNRIAPILKMAVSFVILFM